MKYGIVFLVCGVCLLVVASELQGAAWSLMWLALDFGLVGSAYLGLGPRIFGKRADGSLPYWAIGFFLPFLMLAWSLWQLYRWTSREACHNEVVPGVWVGRRATAHELPPGMDLVVDLTAEFFKPRHVETGRIYVCLPTLDSSAPEEVGFRQLIAKIAACRGNVYIHCALGHGRSATVAAAVLMMRGVADSPSRALDLLRRARPAVKITRPQRRLLEKLTPLPAI